jgi:NADP-dependent 3-hydroxy acid dehydrogenase YdfG
VRFADQGVLVSGAAGGIDEKVAHAIGHEGAVVGSGGPETRRVPDEL